MSSQKHRGPLWTHRHVCTTQCPKTHLKKAHTVPHPPLCRLKAEEERLRKEEDKARREFIKQEYLRRKQLKLMEDMDMVIKPRPTSTKQRRARPKSIHRDSLDSPKTPGRAAAGTKIHILNDPPSPHTLGANRHGFVLCATPHARSLWLLLST